MDTEIIKNIEELFKKWYFKIMLDSTSTWGKSEREDLMQYCSEHLEEFKEFAKDTLEHPYEWCHQIPGMCNELLPDVLPYKRLNEDTVNLIKRLQEEMKKKQYREKWLWEDCNIWLNYFKGTEGVDYYKDYVEYKEYLHRHYIGWSPNKEENPNPTYEEFINNREKYKI